MTQVKPYSSCGWWLIKFCDGQPQYSWCTDIIKQYFRYNFGSILLSFRLNLIVSLDLKVPANNSENFHDSSGGDGEGGTRTGAIHIQKSPRRNVRRIWCPLWSCCATRTVGWVSHRIKEEMWNVMIAWPEFVDFFLGLFLLHISPEYETYHIHPRFRSAEEESI